MPLYDYICEACSHEFSEIQKFSDKPIKTCPSCKKNKVTKKISLSGFALKGEGWYKDGYAKPSAKSDTAGGTDKSSTTTPKSDSTPKTKSAADA